MAEAEFTYEPLEAIAVHATSEAALAAELRTARDAAYAEGLAQGRQAGSAEMATAIGALTEAVEATHALRAELAEQLERDAVALALHLTEKILTGALAVQPERVVEVVRGALRTLIERERVQVLVNGDDLEIVLAAADALTAELGGIEHMEIQAERRVPRGGAIVRTADGEVDATLPAKLDAARALIEAELAG